MTEPDTAALVETVRDAIGRRPREGDDPGMRAASEALDTLAECVAECEERNKDLAERNRRKRHTMDEALDQARGLGLRIQTLEEDKAYWATLADGYREKVSELTEILNDQDQALAAAEARTTRAEAALREIAAGPYNGFEQCRAIARAALTPTEEPPKHPKPEGTVANETTLDIQFPAPTEEPEP